MPSFMGYVTILAMAGSAALAMPQGNSPCAHWCQDNYASCGFKNRGACVSYAAHNGFQCGCPPPPPPPPKCPQGEVWVEATQCCESTNGW